MVIVVSRVGIKKSSLFPLSRSFSPLPFFFFSYPHLHSYSLPLHSPSLFHTQAYKSHSERLTPLGMSQPEARSKGSSPEMLVFVLKAHHQGIFTWRAQIPIIPTWKKGRKGYTQRNSPRTIKGYNNRYFQGTKLQVIFRLRPLEGQNTTIVSIYISAVWLHCHWGKLCVFVQEE